MTLPEQPSAFLRAKLAMIKSNMPRTGGAASKAGANTPKTEFGTLRRKAPHRSDDSGNPAGAEPSGEMQIMRAVDLFARQRAMIERQAEYIAQMEAACRAGAAQLGDAMETIKEAIDLIDAGDIDAARDRLDDYIWTPEDFD